MLYTITGATGCGKTYVANALVKAGWAKERIVTYTTRKPRKGEHQDTDYHFATKEEIRHLFDMGELGWQFHYCNNVYGAPYDEIKRATLDPENNYIIVLDRKSALRLRDAFPIAVRSIYLMSNKSFGHAARRQKARKEADIEAGFFDKSGYDCVISNDASKDELLYEFTNYIFVQGFLKEHRGMHGSSLMAA